MPPTVLKILLVEDSERRKQLFESWAPPDVRIVWARAAGVAIGMLQRSGGRAYDGLLLDHDLTQQNVTAADARYNGNDVVTAVVQRVDRDVPIFVHSGNTGHGSVMAVRLRGAGFGVGHVPMPALQQRRFLEWIEEVRRARAEADEDAEAGA